MNPQETQPELSTGQEMSPEDAKASLGIATHLQGMMLPQEAPTSPGNEPGTEENPGSEEDVKTEIQGLETRLLDELNTLRSEMKTQGDSNQELNDLKKQIEEILNSND